MIDFIKKRPFIIISIVVYIIISVWVINTNSPWLEEADKHIIKGNQRYLYFGIAEMQDMIQFVFGLRHDGVENAYTLHPSWFFSIITGTVVWGTFILDTVLEYMDCGWLEKRCIGYFAGNILMYLSCLLSYSIFPAISPLLDSDNVIFSFVVTLFGSILFLTPGALEGILHMECYQLILNIVGSKADDYSIVSWIVFIVLMIIVELVIMKIATLIVYGLIKAIPEKPLILLIPVIVAIIETIHPYYLV